MMSYINETDFVIENKELVYPEIITDGLQLYYDAKGKRDTDYHRDTMLDMSGNKNHGKLHNFAYEKHSGYKDGLVFDYIDDKLVRPALSLQPNDFTFMLNGNIISFSPDGTVKRVQDGEVIESKGFNLVRNGDFNSPNHPQWGNNNHMNHVLKKNEITITGNGNPNLTATNWFALNVINPSDNNSIYYVTALVKGQGQAYIGINYNVSNLYVDDSFRRISYVGKQETRNSNPGHAVLGGTPNNKLTFKEVMAINLTETFGAGNEPTRTQMHEIVNRFGFIPNAQDLIDRIEYKGNDLGDMENIIDGLYKTEVLSGEEIYADQADDAVVHVDVDGKSYQLKADNLYSQDKSIKGKYYAIGGLIVSADMHHEIMEEYYSVSPGDVVIEQLWNPNGVVNAHRNRFIFYDSNKSFLSFSEAIILNGDPYQDKTHIAPANAAFFRFGSITGIGGVRDENIEVSVSVNYPTTPTPDYPIEIHSLNDFDVVSSVGRENLLLNSEKEHSSSSTIWPIDIVSREHRPMVEGEEYTLSFDLRADSPTKSYRLFLNNSISSWRTFNFGTEWKRDSVTFTFKENDYQNRQIHPHIYPEGSMKKYIRNFKLEKGSTVTPWTPAPEDITESDNHPLIDKINLLLDEPLRSIGDVKDRLFRDSDGIWKIERNVGVITIDETFDFSIHSTDEYTSRYSFLTSLVPHNPSEVIIIADRLLGVPNSRWKDDIESIETDYLGVKFRIKNDRLEEASVENLKSWLINNSINAQHKLAKPTIETLDQEFQDKLNNLRSLEDSNHVYTVLQNENNRLSDKLKPTLHAKFLYSNWYKEDRVINNLMIYNRALTNEEMLQNYKTIKRRWGM